jgi:hypothetical protein
LKEIEGKVGETGRRGRNVSNYWMTVRKKDAGN